MPYEKISITNILKCLILGEQQSFQNKEIPEVTAVHGYKLWSFLKSSIEEIIEYQSFRDVVSLLNAADRSSNPPPIKRNY